VSSRIALEREDLLPVRTYAVQVPDMRQKKAIAQQAADGVSVKAFSELLDSVGSGLLERIRCRSHHPACGRRSRGGSHGLAMGACTTNP
jgi:hypothetical protein